MFVGPSGCGKSTLLRLIAGLEDVTSGQILIDGKDVTNIGPSQRGLAMVFQSYALYPHMSVRGNIAFALKMAGQSADMIEQKVRKAAATLNLTDYLDRKPRQLSGGQRQRVAIGRAIVREPKAFLFDEPLSNLDAALRVQMRVEIGELHDALKTTMIYVTHDQVEAMTMADKIVVLDRGSVAQVGSPLELYNRPNGLFVAGFIGSPTMNLIKGAAERRSAAPKQSASAPNMPTFRPPRASGLRRCGSPSTRVRHFHPCGSRRNRPAHPAARRRGAADAGPEHFRHAARSAPASLRQGRQEDRLTADAARAGRDQFDGWTSKSDDRQTFRRRARATCRQASRRRNIDARTLAPASFISASAIFTARIRRSISTICSTPGAITTGRSSGRGCAKRTSRSVRSLRSRTG